jgi:hypothetical protein
LNAFLTRSHAVNICAGDVLRSIFPLLGGSQTLSGQEYKSKNAELCLYVIDYKFVNHRASRSQEHENRAFRLRQDGQLPGSTIIPEITIDTI